MIACITPNPALDHTLVIPSLRLGAVQRANQTIITAGGKGVNVARAIHTLGGDPLCMGFLGGYIGRQMAELVEHEGLHSAWTWVANETRFSLILNDPDRRESTVINGHGPTVTANDWARLQIKVAHTTPPATQVCISGSLPPGSPLDAYTGLIRTLTESGNTVWIDSSGTALLAALQVAGISLKVNGDEIGALLQRKVKTIGEAYEAAAELSCAGLNAIIVTLGLSGAVLIDADSGWHARPPAIQVVNAVGSGDAFLGGWVTALANHLPASEALRWAVAAGAANALSSSTGKFTRADFEKLLAETVVEPRSA